MHDSTHTEPEIEFEELSDDILGEVVGGGLAVPTVVAKIVGGI